MRSRLAVAGFFATLLPCITVGVAAACTTSNIRARASAPQHGDNSPEALRRLAEAALEAAKGGDDQKLLDITKSMVMPNPEEWFGKVFGPRAGDISGGRYRGHMSQAPAELARDFKLMLQQNYTSVTVERFTESCNGSTDAHLFPVLSARKFAEPLSWLRFGDGENSKILRYFAYVDRAFRFVGNLEFIPNSDPPLEDSVRYPPIVAGASAVVAHRLDHTQPEYPKEARRRGIQGTVKLHVMIGLDGKTHNIHVLSGMCVLADSALRAVEKFRYSPTTINGTPVPVETTVNVVFNLSQSEHP
jgi:TonB family protein